MIRTSQPEFEGFDSFYGREMAAYIEALKGKRRSALRRLLVFAVPTTAAILYLTYRVYMATHEVLFVFMLAVLLMVIWLIFIAIFFGPLSGGLGKFLMQKICEFLGWSYETDNAEALNLDEWIELGLLPKDCNQVSFAHEMTGTIDGLPFRAAKCVMCNTRRKSSFVDFKGVVIEVTVPSDIQGRLAVIYDPVFKGPKSRADLERVEISDPRFQGAFQTYASSDVDVHQALTAKRIEDILALEELATGKLSAKNSFDFALTPSRSLISYYDEDPFRARSLIDKGDEDASVQKFVNQFCKIIGLVKAIAAPHP